jgi:hypothetical protein
LLLAVNGYVLSVDNAVLPLSSCILNRNKSTLQSPKIVKALIVNINILLSFVLTFGSISKNASVSQSEISKDSWIRSLAAASSPVLDDGANARAP